MNKIQIFRLFSILSAIAVGLWLPLKLIGISFPRELDLALDFLVSCSAASNIAIFFYERKLSSNDWRSWIKLSVLLDMICVMPLLLIEDWFFDGAHVSLVFLNLLVCRHVWNIKAFLDEFDNLKPIVY